MENETNSDLQIAIDSFKAQNYEKAIEAFQDVLKTDENNPNVLNNIGLCYSKLANDEKATEYFVKTLSINPKSVQTYINLSDVYYRYHRIFLKASVNGSKNRLRYLLTGHK